MATIVLIHGAGDSGWAWHRVTAELQCRGHEVVAPDLPCERDDAGLPEYAAAVGAAVRALASRDGPSVVVGHSLGAFVAPLVAEREGGSLILLAPMIPSPGETISEWWSASGYSGAARRQREADGGLTNHPDPFVSFYNDVPRELAEEAMRRSRTQSAAPLDQPLPLTSWPDVPTRVLLFRDDRFLPLEFGRRLARERLGVVAEELPGGHCAPLSHPRELVDALLRDVAVTARPPDLLTAALTTAPAAPSRRR